MDDYQLYIEFASAFGLGALFIGLICLYLLKNPLVIFKIWKFLAKLLYDIFGIWKKAAIASQIETHINSGIQQLGSESPAAFTNGLKLEWISTGEEHSQLEDGAIIIRVRNDPDISVPLVNATMLYLQTGVIHDSRPYIENRLLKAVDLILAYRILMNSPSRNAINYLTSNYLEPSLKDTLLAKLYEACDTVDQLGLLTRIVLREFSGYAAKLKGGRPTIATRTESVNFFEFVGRVVQRKGEVPLTFFGRYLRCTIALIAKPEIYEQSGLVLYQRNFQRDIDIGMNVIYLLTRGPKNLQVGRSLAKWATEQGLISGSIPDRYLQPDETGQLIPAECIVCFSSRVGRSIQISPLEEALIAVSQIIPESLTGEVDIVSLAREPGIITKILVHSDHGDPVEICSGPSQRRIHSISEILGKAERVDIVRWSPDPRRNVISALVPLQDDDVSNIFVAPDSLSANVLVRSHEAAQRAVGKDGINLRVSQRLLNMHINLEVKETSITPEEELAKLATQLIKEISEGKIKITKIARRVGRAAKIVVASSEIQDPARLCMGPGGSITRALSQALGGEQITFISWKEDKVEKMLREALHPLRNKEIVSITIDQEERKAVVTVHKGGIIATAIGKEGDNVRLAERICDLKIEIRENQ